MILRKRIWYRDRIMPNLIGIDIGCGMTLGKIKGKKIEGQKLDTVIRDCVPSGFNIRRKPHRFADDFNFSDLYCSAHIRTDKARLSLGTLGGGNHFIELDKDTDNDLYIVKIDKIIKPVYNYKAGGE